MSQKATEDQIQMFNDLVSENRYGDALTLLQTLGENGIVGDGDYFEGLSILYKALRGSENEVLDELGTSIISLVEEASDDAKKLQRVWDRVDSLGVSHDFKMSVVEIITEHVLHTFEKVEVREEGITSNGETIVLWETKK